MKPDRDWLDYIGLLGPCVALVGLIVGYWLAERSKRTERRLQMLRSVYLDVIADWAGVMGKLARIPLMEADEVQKAFTSGLDDAAVNHHRMFLIAPVERCQQLMDLEPQVRSITLTAIAAIIGGMPKGSSGRQEVQREIFKLMCDFRRAILPILANMRHDLENSDSRKAFLRSQQESISRAEKMMNDLLSGLMPADSAEAQFHRSAKEIQISGSTFTSNTPSTSL